MTFQKPFTCPNNHECLEAINYLKEKGIPFAHKVQELLVDWFKSEKPGEVPLKIIERNISTSINRREAAQNDYEKWKKIKEDRIKQDHIEKEKKLKSNEERMQIQEEERQKSIQKEIKNQSRFILDRFDASEEQALEAAERYVHRDRGELISFNDFMEKEGLVKRQLEDTKVISNDDGSNKERIEQIKRRLDEIREDGDGLKERRENETINEDDYWKAMDPLSEESNELREELKELNLSTREGNKEDQ